jgi:hypothetical protein
MPDVSEFTINDHLTFTLQPVLFTSTELHVCLYTQQFASCIHLCFVNFAVHPAAQTEIKRRVWRYKQLSLVATRK